EPRRTDGSARGPPRSDPVSADASAQSSKARTCSGILGEGRGQRRQSIRCKHVPIARFSQDPGQPADLLYEWSHALRSGEPCDQRQARAQPASANAHLMNPLRIGVGDKSGGVARDLAKALSRDGAQRLLGRSVWRKLDRLGTDGLLPPVRLAMRE